MATKTTKTTKTTAANGQFVLVRCTGAGVHCGIEVSRTDTTVTLRGARRVWRWRGANTLNELSLRGCDESYSRISEPVAEITLSGWHEILSCTPAARENLSRARWGA